MGETTLSCSGAVEGPVDEAVLRRIVRDFNISLDAVYIANGKPNLLRQLPGYNNAAHYHPWVVLVDLDRSAECAPPIRELWLPNPAPGMSFRIAVRAIEAWLLADRERIANYLGVSVARVPLEPEALDEPKAALVNLARHSGRRAICEGIVPREGSGRQVGPTYTSQMIAYANNAWRPDVAEIDAESLRRFRTRLASAGG